MRGTHILPWGGGENNHFIKQEKDMTDHHIAKAKQQLIKSSADSGFNAAEPIMLKPWSIRNAMRHLASRSIDLDKRSVSVALPPKPTIAQCIAAAALDAAMNGNIKAIQYVTDQIDGKTLDNRMHEDFLAIQAMTDEELDEFLAACHENERSSNNDRESASQGSTDRGIVVRKKKHEKQCFTGRVR
jgi:hypothetical protein